MSMSDQIRREQEYIDGIHRMRYQHCSWWQGYREMQYTFVTPVDQCLPRDRSLSFKNAILPSSFSFLPLPLRTLAETSYDADIDRSGVPSKNRWNPLLVPCEASRLFVSCSILISSSTKMRSYQEISWYGFVLACIIIMSPANKQDWETHDILLNAIWIYKSLLYI